MFGLINLNKPASWTSHDCVAKIRKILKLKQVGHGGTLDPAATGVLPIAVGKATRLLPYMSEQKAYLAKIRFGVITTTDDLEGEIIQTHWAEHLTLEFVQSHLAHFIGEIEQVPPMYSAIQRDGKRMYQLARKGEMIDIPSRIVKIYKIEVSNWQGGEFPEIELAIACGSGTYIRAIARDLGATLGVGGTLAQLIRTESCGLHLADSTTLEELERLQGQDKLVLLPPAISLGHLNTVYLASSEAHRWCQGQAIVISAQVPPQSSVKVLAEDNLFLGMGLVIHDLDHIILKPKVVLI